MNKDNGQGHSLIARVLVSAFVLIILIFSEWLFFVTRPSSFGSTGWWERLAVLFTAPVLPIMLASCALLLFFAMAFLNKKIWMISILLPAGTLAATLFLLLENFTSTVFDFGVRSLAFPSAILYLVIFLVLLFFSIRWITNWEGFLKRKLSGRFLVRAAAILVGVLLFLGYAGCRLARMEYPPASESISELRNSSSILLIGSDGVNADHMSAYGYEKNTTPSIAKFAGEALVFENAFANASRTQASLVSMLSGKLPTETRLICAPDILRGADAYQHLPGILKRYHYRNIQLTVRGFGDAYDANMRMAFDSVNLRTSDEIIVLRLSRGFLISEASYLLQQIYERIAQRLLHVTGIRRMPDPFREVMGLTGERYSDSTKVDALLDFISASNTPFFAHVHFMATHRNRIKIQNDNDNDTGDDESLPLPTELYEEAIQSFDEKFDRVIRFLRETGRLERTLVIVYSDHGWRHSTSWRVPLMIRFPKLEHTGAVSRTVENIDIAPTILDYLGIDKPAWMSGESLIGGKKSTCEPVISVRPIRTYDQQLKFQHRAEAGPPFYTLGAVSVVTCDRFFTYDLERGRLAGKKLPHSDDNCGQCDRLERRDALRFILDHLKESGYDTSTLEQSD